MTPKANVLPAPNVQRTARPRKATIGRKKKTAKGPLSREFLMIGGFLSGCVVVAAVIFYGVLFPGAENAGADDGTTAPRAAAQTNSLGVVVSEDATTLGEGRRLPPLPARTVQDDRGEHWFMIGPVRLGMTLKAYKAENPNGTVAELARGKWRGNSREGVRSYTAVFTPTTWSEGPERHVMYRLIMEEPIRNTSAAQIIDNLASLYGKPVSIDCDKQNSRAGRTCTIDWWPVNGAKLRARLQSATGKGLSSHVLRLEAVDTYIAGKRLRHTSQFAGLR